MAVSNWKACFNIQKNFETRLKIQFLPHHGQSRVGCGQQVWVSSGYVKRP